jgi:hypothetical protein
MWKGAAETLKARPQIRKTRPNSTPVPAPAVTTLEISRNRVEPAKP